MGFENVESIFIDNKEVQSIVVKDSGAILFQKSNDIENLPVMTLTITGSSFATYSSTPFGYTGKVFVDWGNDTDLIEYNGGQLSYSFTDGAATHTVKIYGDIISLGYNCFKGCTGLTSITISDSVTNIEGSCFNGCTGLVSIAISDNVTSLGQYCFEGCTGLTSITIPNSVISIENGCFYDCANLTSITISNRVTSIQLYCFWNCTSLTSITIPDSVTNLRQDCFNNCISLTSINIPNNVTSMEDYCFYSCTHLTSMHLNWDSSTNILAYNSNWIINTSTSLKFIIPYGTTQLYIDKGYPSDKLKEIQPLTLWAPELNGETGADYVYSYSESNGEAVGKGFVLKNGFDNIDNWELSFEFKHDKVSYTGICFLTDLASGYKGNGGSSTALTTWEGSWPNGSAYATYNSGTVGYFDVTVTKIDSTHVRLQSSALDRDTTVELLWLSSAEKLSIGARHNPSSGNNGPCRIRNVLVKQKIIKTIDVDDDGEIGGTYIELNP